MSSFALFPLLPTELRLEIWRQGCQPRVVQVRYSQDHDRCLSTTRPPTVLQVCSEARDEALRSCYVRAFGTRTHAAEIYFAPALDILYIPRNGDMGYADTARDLAVLVRDTTKHVRSLAIDHVKPEIRRPWETYSKFCLMRNFPHLRETFLIIAEDGQGEQGEVEFVDPRGDRDTIMRLMEDVKESFVCEVGPDWYRWDMPTSCQPYLELVPKAKAHGWVAAV